MKPTAPPLPPLDCGGNLKPTAIIQQYIYIATPNRWNKDLSTPLFKSKHYPMSAKETELTRSGNSKRAPSPVDTGVNLRRLSERERNLRPAWISLKHKFQRAMRTLIARSHAKRIIAAATQDLNIAKVGAPTKNRSKFARCFKKTRAPVECLLHLVTLYLIWTVTLNCIWTYDSYDAVAVVERQLLQSESAYNHEMSEYMLVDSISSLDVWMTNTVSTLFRQDNTRPLLRYGKYQDKDSICTPTYRNISYPH